MTTEAAAAGRLIYLMGPSGAGKDSLLAGARRVLDGAPVAFAHRYITRPPDPHGENHVPLSEAEFAVRRDRDCFLLHWRSHGLSYGLGREIADWMGRGLTVVMNGSRGYLPDAMARVPDLVPVMVTVDLGVLRRRLEHRGRESAAEIEERLERARTDFATDVPGLRTLDNSGHLDDAVTAFAELIRRTGDAPGPDTAPGG